MVTPRKIISREALNNFTHHLEDIMSELTTIVSPTFRRRRTQLAFHEPSLTEQSHADSCDIHKILARFIDGIPLPGNARPPTYGDFSTGIDFHAARNSLIESQASFDALPASIRRRFGEDPGAFLDFMSNEENLEEAIKMGLLPKPPEPTKTEVKPPENTPKSEGEKPPE